MVDNLSNVELVYSHIDKDPRKVLKVLIGEMEEWRIANIRRELEERWWDNIEIPDDTFNDFFKFNILKDVTNDVGDVTGTEAYYLCKLCGRTISCYGNHSSYLKRHIMYDCGKASQGKYHVESLGEFIQWLI